jgi:DNA primase
LRFGKGFEKSRYLYNYAQAKKSKKPFVLLVEGAPDVFRASEADVPAISTLGLDLSVFQADMLVYLSKEIVVAFDNDPAGKAAAKRVESMLKEYRDCRKVTVYHPPLGVKDIGEMSPSEVVPWLNTRCN